MYPWLPEDDYALARGSAFALTCVGPVEDTVDQVLRQTPAMMGTVAACVIVGLTAAA